MLTGLLAFAGCRTTPIGYTTKNIHTCSRQTGAFHLRPGCACCQGHRDRCRKDPATQVRGGLTQVNLSATATVASLIAGNVGGAIGVGVSYPFDTLSTKAQVNTGTENARLGVVKNVARIWKNEGLEGFFEGVLSTVRHLLWINIVKFIVNYLFQYRFR